MRFDCSVARLSMLAVAGLALAGCATITRSPSTDWKVSSMPEGAEVSTSNGIHCDATPCSFHVRRKTAFSATVNMPGYEPQTLTVIPTMEPLGGLALAGNVVIGGLPGIVTDVWTGSILDLSNNGQVVRLSPAAGYAPASARTNGAITVAAATTVCDADKLRYAAQVGVPCWSLGNRVYFQAAR